MAPRFLRQEREKGAGRGPGRADVERQLEKYHRAWHPAAHWGRGWGTRHGDPTAARGYLSVRDRRGLLVAGTVSCFIPAPTRPARASVHVHVAGADRLYALYFLVMYRNVLGL